jgi:hypothetical protein
MTDKIRTGASNLRHTQNNSANLIHTRVILLMLMTLRLSV